MSTEKSNISRRGILRAGAGATAAIGIPVLPAPSALPAAPSIMLSGPPKVIDTNMPSKQMLDLVVMDREYGRGGETINVQLKIDNPEEVKQFIDGDNTILFNCDDSYGFPDLLYSLTNICDALNELSRSKISFEDALAVYRQPSEALKKVLSVLGSTADQAGSLGELPVLYNNIFGENCSEKSIRKTIKERCQNALLEAIDKKLISVEDSNHSQIFKYISKHFLKGHPRRDEITATWYAELDKVEEKRDADSKEAYRLKKERGRLADEVAEKNEKNIRSAQITNGSRTQTFCSLNEEYVDNAAARFYIESTPRVTVTDVHTTVQELAAATKHRHLVLGDLKIGRDYTLTQKSDRSVEITIRNNKLRDHFQSCGTSISVSILARPELSNLKMRIDSVARLNKSDLS